MMCVANLGRDSTWLGTLTKFVLSGTLRLNSTQAMTITLSAEQDSTVTRLVALGRFASAEEAVTEAVRRLEYDDVADVLNPKPLTTEEAEQVYAADPEWEKVEQAVAGRVRPEL